MRSFLTRALLGAVAFLAATPALAADWTFASMDQDHLTAVFFDRESLEKSPGNVVRIWGFFVFSEDEEGVAAISAHQEYDCPARRFRRLYLVGYRADSTVAAEGRLVTEWKPVRPNTLDQASLDFVCSGRLQEEGLTTLGNTLPLDYGRELLRGE